MASGNKNFLEQHTNINKQKISKLITELIIKKKNPHSPCKNLIQAMLLKSIGNTPPSNLKAEITAKTVTISEKIIKLTNNGFFVLIGSKIELNNEFMLYFMKKFRHNMPH